MKIGITGHTKGIGAAVADKFISEGHDVVGFSRSNGYDISSAECRKRIVAEAQDCDIFFNNAYLEDAQIRLMQDLWPFWKDTNKIIVVNGSTSAHNFQDHLDHPAYGSWKAGLHHYCRVLCEAFMYPKKCRVTYLTPGVITTEMSTKLNPTYPKQLIPEEVADVVYYVSTLPPHVELQEVKIQHTEMLNQLKEDCVTAIWARREGQ